jgi:hypothetical protein
MYMKKQGKKHMEWDLLKIVAQRKHLRFYMHDLLNKWSVYNRMFNMEIRYGIWQ